MFFGNNNVEKLKSNVERLKKDIELGQQKLKAVSNIFTQYDSRGYKVTAEKIDRIVPGFMTKVEEMIKNEVLKHPHEMHGENFDREIKLQLGNQVTSYILNAKSQLGQLVEEYKEDLEKLNSLGQAGGSHLKMKQISKKRQEEFIKNIIKNSSPKKKNKKRTSQKGGLLKKGASLQQGGICGATFSPFTSPVAGSTVSVQASTWVKPSSSTTNVAKPTTPTVSKTASANLGKMSNADLNDAANDALRASQTGGKSDKIVKELVKKIRKQKGGICGATFSDFKVNPVAVAWKFPETKCDTVGTSTQKGGKKTQKVVNDIIKIIKNQRGGDLAMTAAPFVNYAPGDITTFLDRSSSGTPVDMANTHSAWSKGKVDTKAAPKQAGGKKKKVIKRKKQKGGCSGDLAPFVPTSTATVKATDLSVPKPAQSGGKKIVKKGGNSKCVDGMKKKIIKIKKKIVIIGDSSSDSDW